MTEIHEADVEFKQSLGVKWVRGASGRRRGGGLGSLLRRDGREALRP